MLRLRPFYFVVVVWGQQFCDYLTEYCVPSLLADGNIPSLRNKNSKFLICTTKEDWSKLLQNTSIICLRQYVELILVEIPPKPDVVQSCVHMGVGHKKATEICFRDQVYGVILAPDLVLSENAVSKIQSLALDGKEVVLCPALRFAQEPFFKGLDELGIRHRAPKRNRKTALAVTSEQLVQLSLISFHSETVTYDFDSPYFLLGRAIVLWRLPNNKGMVLRCMNWCPLLIDYSKIVKHDTTALEEWTIDGDYIYKNFPQSDNFFICSDSDELMLISWSPLEYNSVQLVPGLFRVINKKLCHFINNIILMKTLANPLFDPQKKDFFRTSICWHSHQIDSDWILNESQINRVIDKYDNKKVLKKLALLIYSVILLIKKISRYCYICLLLFLGNRKAKEKISKRIKYLYKIYFIGILEKLRS